MKDNRFIVLLNLYIDRQITAAETAELEAEIQAQPRRRALYRQYCQMHSATKQVYASFRAQADDQAAAQPAGRGAIASFDQRRPARAGWRYYAGGLAAAACLALVFVRFAPSAQSFAGVPAKTESAPAVQMAAMPAAAPAHVAVEPQPGLISLRHNLAAEPDYAAVLSSLRQEDQRTFANGQLQPARVPSLFDDGVFDAHPVLPAGNQRVFRGKQAPTQSAEFTAFQFQR